MNAIKSSVDQMFADDRPGLHYKPIQFTGLAKPIFVLEDHRRTHWVDLRSVCEALGVAWNRFDLMIRSQREYLKAEACADRVGRKTELLSPDRLLRWVDLCRPLFAQHSGTALQRALLLRRAWRSEAKLALADAYPGSAIEVTEAAKSTPQRSRKITGNVIEQLFRLRAEGASFSAAAKRLGISLSAAKKLASDTYPDLAPEAQAAWDRTFGSNFPAKAQNTPAK